jgi:hypothetical protein
MYLCTLHAHSLLRSYFVLGTLLAFEYDDLPRIHLSCVDRIYVEIDSPIRPYRYAHQEENKRKNS